MFGKVLRPIQRKLLKIVSAFIVICLFILISCQQTSSNDENVNQTTSTTTQEDLLEGYNDALRAAGFLYDEDYFNLTSVISCYVAIKSSQLEFCVDNDGELISQNLNGTIVSFAFFNGVAKNLDTTTLYSNCMWRRFPINDEIYSYNIRCQIT